MATLADIAEELYALPPQEFTAARNARAGELRGDDRELSDAVRGLKKPSPAAWVANLVAREEPDRLEALIDLGARLRQAQEEGDRVAFTALARERRDALDALVGSAEELATGRGGTVNRGVLDQVTETLSAAMVDPDAAAAVRAGVLVRGLTSIGFEPVDLTDAVAIEVPGTRPRRAPAPPRGRPKLRAVKDPDAELKRARTEARQAVRAAEGDVEDAESAAAELAERARATDAHRSELEDELADLEDELQRTRAALNRAERQLRDLDRERGAAERTLDRARTALEKARERLSSLE